MKHQIGIISEYIPEKFKNLIKEILSVYSYLIEEIRYLSKYPSIRQNLNLIYGPSNHDFDRNDVVIITVVRDEEAVIESFLKHHFNIGIRHIFLLDNNSLDRTIDIAKQFSNISIYRCNIDFKKNKNFIRRYASSLFGRNCWSLVLDADELFYYPKHDMLALRDFIEYLQNNKYDAVTCQMLDMIANKPLNETAEKLDYPDNEFKYYDISNIHRRDFEENSKLKTTNTNIKILAGGIRNKVFNMPYKLPYMTKIKLINTADGIRFREDNGTENATLADISCVLLHYKFLRNFHNKCKTVVQRENYWKDSLEYKSYLKKLEQNPEINLYSETARELTNIEELIKSGYIIVSENYVNYVKQSV